MGTFKFRKISPFTNDLRIFSCELTPWIFDLEPVVRPILTGTSGKNLQTELINNNVDLTATSKFSGVYESILVATRAKLKEDVTISDVEEHLGTMCNIVKNKYKGFLAGQVFEYAGFVSKEGSVGDLGPEGNHIAIITYWTTFDEHERSHADEDFKNEFCKLLEFCDDTKELGYKLMWQGEQELDNLYKEVIK